MSKRQNIPTELSIYYFLNQNNIARLQKEEEEEKEESKDKNYKYLYNKYKNKYIQLKKKLNNSGGSLHCSGENCIEKPKYKLKQDEIKQLYQFFNKLDCNDSGKVLREDLNLAVTKDPNSILFNKMGIQNKEGEPLYQVITISEFIKWFVKIAKVKGEKTIKTLILHMNKTIPEWSRPGCEKYYKIYVNSDVNRLKKEFNKVK